MPWRPLHSLVHELLFTRSQAYESAVAPVMLRFPLHETQKDHFPVKAVTVLLPSASNPSRSV